jgi:archaellin
MILVAGIAASVLIETMNNLEQQALKTGQDTMSDVSSGIKVTQINGYYDGSSITQIGIFIRTTAGSEEIDLAQTFITISDTTKQVILNYTTNVFGSTVSDGLFGTVNSSNLSATTYGVLKIRDIDTSCTSTNPVINSDDLVVLLVNTTYCFSGLGSRVNVFGNVVPEQGIRGVISFTTPSALIDTIIELQP